MEIRRAVSCDAETIMQITHAAIEAVYPIYYNGSCVEFFLNLHSLGNIKSSIENDSVLFWRLTVSLRQPALLTKTIY